MSIGLSLKKVTARKQHKCYLCGEAINKSENHRVWTGICYDKFYRKRAHEECFIYAVNNFSSDDWHVFMEGDMGRPKTKDQQ